MRKGKRCMNDLDKPKIGLLPLMLEMYRKYAPEILQHQKSFIDTIVEGLKKFSEVSVLPVCSTKREVSGGVKTLENGDIDLLVVVFIAYATSISALNPLLKTHIPLLLFSTTPKSSMAEGMTMQDIMLNHGVHGYMDLANVLKRNKRQFFFVSGKKDDEGSFKEIEQWAKMAQVKISLKDSIIGIAGYTFDGMGDFGIDTTHLNASLGPEVRHIPLNLLAEHIKSIPEKEIKEEIDKDRANFIVDDSVSEDLHRESNRFYLALQKTVSELSLNAFTMHFQGILENPEIKTLPFLAISKLQQKGLAYAGEGDVLGATANLMMRLLFRNGLFSETFCPDFDGERIVMGHMGESNPAFGTKTVLRRKKFAFGKAVDPVIADVHMEEGRATVLNLGVVEENRFQMIVYTGQICSRIPGSDDIDMPYFHFKPDMNLKDFLTEYGIAGGTHHTAMTRGDRVDDLVRLAELLGIDVCVIM